MADQGSVNDYAASLVVGTRALELESITVLNMSANNYYLQLFNYPFAVEVARNVTDSTAAGSSPASSLFVVNHGLKTGDAVTIGGALNFGNCYVRVPPAGVPGAENTFYCYTTQAQALAGGIVGLFPVVSDHTTGTVLLISTTFAPVIPEEMPLMGTGAAPSNIVSYLNGRFTRGLYVRIVTAVNGATLGGADAKFSPRFRYAHGA